MVDPVRGGSTCRTRRASELTTPVRGGQDWIGGRGAGAPWVDNPAEDRISLKEWDFLSREDASPLGLDRHMNELDRHMNELDRHMNELDRHVKHWTVT